MRELQNIIERAVILSNGPDLALERAMAGSTRAPATVSEPETETAPRVLTIAEMDEFERSNIRRA